MKKQHIQLSEVHKLTLKNLVSKGKGNAKKYKRTLALLELDREKTGSLGIQGVDTKCRGEYKAHPSGHHLWMPLHIPVPPQDPKEPKNFYSSRPNSRCKQTVSTWAKKYKKEGLTFLEDKTDLVDHQLSAASAKLALPLSLVVNSQKDTVAGH